jgi:hypothetical protein
MIPPTAQRVPRNTAEPLNQQIQETTQENIALYARRGREAIAQRLGELDEEWDIERTLEANAAAISLLGLGLGTFVDRRLYVLPAVVGGFLLMHAIQGWCPPVPLFRRLGIRTQTEIDEEKYALKALRGDFRDVRPPSEGDGWFEVRQAYRAARG